MAEILFLGTGGSMPTRTRDNTAFLLSAGSSRVLIDCPGAVISKLLTAGVDPLSVQALFVTHVHPDHIYGLPSLVHGLMLHDHVIRLFGSSETIAFCAELLDLFHLRTPRYRTRVEPTVLSPGEPDTSIEGMAATARRVAHHPSSLAYKFEIGDGETNAFFSGDTAAEAEFFSWAKGAAWLFHDCSLPSRVFTQYPALSSVHTSSLDLGRLSQEAGVRSLVPCHFLGEIEFSVAEVEHEIRTHYTGRLVIPSDMERLAL